MPALTTVDTEAAANGGASDCPVSNTLIFPGRVWAFVGVLALECAALSALPHTFFVPSRTFTAAGIVFFVALLFFGRSTLSTLRSREDEPGRAATGAMPFTALHLGALALVVATNVELMQAFADGKPLLGAMLAAWGCGIALLPASLATAFFAPRSLMRAARGLGSAWGLAALCGLVAGIARHFMLIQWDAQSTPIAQWMQTETFRGVKAILGVVYSGVVSDPGSATLGTSNFQVQVAGYCSGIEGLALMLVLTLCWLVYARKELRLDRAWLLVPASLLVIWTLNLARIAALIAIGDAGYEEVALGGFHSEAGWILFNTVALGFLLAIERIRWFRNDAVARGTPGEPVAPLLMADAESQTNTAAVYLMPLLAMLACSLISRAASDGGGFDALYPLRLFAVAGVAWAYRRHYRTIDWRFGWLGPAAGVAVFGMWILAQRWTTWIQPDGNGDAGAGLAAGLADLPHWSRMAWLAARSVAATITVPVAEELAFRGYLARRVMSADVESVSLRRLGAVALAVSSLAFGLMHGKMWIAGTLAGLVFALVARRRGRLGEAVAAHATANLLIAVWVLARGDYSLW